MITAGLDIGSLATKAVIIDDGSILSWSLLPMGESGKWTASKAMEQAAADAKLSPADIASVVATGVGKNENPYSAETATEVMCDAQGAKQLYPRMAGVIDIGAEVCRAIKCDQLGNVIDFALNDKCASGTGVFLDSMAKALGVKPEEMGELSSKSEQEVNITSTCAVFAESEVLSLIHRKVNRVDILKGIHRSIAGRVAGLVDRLRMEGDIIVVGGIAQNVGVITLLAELTKPNLIVPPQPQIVGALGAAIIAQERTKAQ